MQTPSSLPPSLSRLVFLALLLGACSGASSTELFERGAGGAAPSASPSASPTDTPSPGMTDDDAAAQTPDGGKKDATSPTPPAQPKNPMAGAGAVTKVAVGYGSLEGPVWRSASSSLFFSDLDGNSIERFAPPATFSTYRFPSGGSNGLAVDAQGQLVVCEGKNRRVTRTPSNGGAPEIIAAEWQGAKLNAPNDVIVRSDGTVYFTDPDYSVQGARELEFNGVYRVGPNKVMALVADDLAKPNGIALSPSGATLYVTDEASGFIRAYDVASDGATSNPRKFAEASHPDGMAVDDAGNVYVAVETGIAIFAPDGSSWGTLPVPQQPANVAFGGSTGKTLFITALDTLYAVDLEVAGPP